MAQTFWTYSGGIAVDAQGRPILCDECPCPGNACNSCVPPIPDTMYVTVSLCSCLSSYSGKHEMTWEGGCSWKYYFGPSDFPALRLWRMADGFGNPRWWVGFELTDTACAWQVDHGCPTTKTAIYWSTLQVRCTPWDGVYASGSVEGWYPPLFNPNFECMALNRYDGSECVVSLT